MSAPALLDSLPSVGQTIVVTFPADAWSEPDHRTVLVLSRDGDSVDVRASATTASSSTTAEFDPPSVPPPATTSRPVPSWAPLLTIPTLPLTPSTAATGTTPETTGTTDTTPTSEEDAASE